MGRFICVLVSLVCGLSVCVSSRHNPFDSKEATRIPARINIALIGLSGDGGAAAKVSSHDLKTILQAALPVHRPSSLSSKEALAVEYEIRYNVVEFPSLLAPVEAGIREQLSQQGKAVNGLFELGASKAELSTFNKIHERAEFGFRSHQQFNDRGGSSMTVYVVCPRKSQLSPTGSHTDFEYQYKYAGAGAGQIWLADQKYMVVDLTAKRVHLGAANDHSGFLGSHTVPLGSELAQESAVQWRAKLATLLVRAVQHVALPDILHAQPEFAEKIYVPVLVFTNHRQFNPLDKSAGEHYIDTKHIEKQVKKLLLPTQRVHLMAETLSIGDHLHVSMALARAIRDDTVHQAVPSKGQRTVRYQLRSQRYLDSAIIRNEFNKSFHMLDSVGPQMSMLRKRKELWQFFHPMVPPVLDRNDLSGHSRLQLSDGVQVLPVYVFSLMQMQHSLHFDRKSKWSATSDTVFILQTDTQASAIPYFMGGKPIMTDGVSGEHGATTTHIMAGLATALGGLIAPTVRWSPLHKRTVHDWAWAVGCQPWGPFSGSAILSELMASMVLRNFILANLHTAQHIVWKVVERLNIFTQKYLYDPFAQSAQQDIGFFSLSNSKESPFPVHTVEALEEGMEQLQTTLKLIASLVGENKFQQAHSPASSLVKRAKAFEVYAENELQGAESSLACCSVQHSTSKPYDYTHLVKVCGAAAAVFLIVFCVFHGQATKTKRRF